MCALHSIIVVILISVGAFMTNRLACQAGLKQDGEPWIRAIATHSGLIGKDEETSSCQPHTVVPVIAFQVSFLFVAFCHFISYAKSVFSYACACAMCGRRMMILRLELRVTAQRE